MEDLDLIRVLTKLHREVIARDVERIVGAAERRLRDEMHTSSIRSPNRSTS